MKIDAKNRLAGTTQSLEMRRLLLQPKRVGAIGTLFEGENAVSQTLSLGEKKLNPNCLTYQGWVIVPGNRFDLGEIVNFKQIGKQGKLILHR